MNHKSYDRNARVEGAIRAVLAELLQHEVNDPRLTGVTVSAIRLSSDRTQARVYFSVLGDAERERQAGDGFTAAAAFMRREFFRDTSYEYGDRMERLFERLHFDDNPTTDDGTAEG
jgi:ribosome-binding factor A